MKIQWLLVLVATISVYIVLYLILYRANSRTDVQSVSNVNQPKIAFIFAGSVRSFVCPRVHWTIKANLIDALGGDAYTFARVTLEDNVNSQTGDGQLTTPQYTRSEVDETLKLLDPVDVEYFTLSSQEDEMKVLFPERIHSVFRENDLRRYSMFYHRSMVYRMMQRYEQKYSIKFDWVVLTRLDAAWLEPVYPISAYMNDRVWLTETGFAPLNDQFMLIPRQFSDYLYDLQTKVKQGVYCLGGPDVEQWKCNRTELERRHTPQSVIEERTQYCCSDVMEQNREGYSEIIHKRHLEAGGIPISFARFPVALTRRNKRGECNVECFRLNIHYKDHQFSGNQRGYYRYRAPSVFPDTGGRAISVRDKLMCHRIAQPAFSWNPIAAVKLHSLWGYRLDYSRSLWSQRKSLHPSLTMNNKQMEAWRIHPTMNVGGCLSLSFTHQNLSWRECNDHWDVETLRFDPRQVFFLSVLSPVDFVPIFDIQGVRLMSSAQNPFYGKPSSVSNVTRVEVYHWDMDQYQNELFTPLCLSVAGYTEGAKVRLTKCSPNPLEKRQLFLSVSASYELGSHSQSMVGQLRLAYRPTMCVGRAEVDEVKRGNSFVPGGDGLVVLPCKDSLQNFVNFEFELVTS